MPTTRRTDTRGICLASQAHWESHYFARARAHKRNRIKAALDQALAADEFELPAWLADREHFPEAALMLRDEFRGCTFGGNSLWPDPLAILQDRFNARLRPFRMACAFGAISQGATRTAQFSMAELRALTSPAAGVALAALGEIDWHCASRRARAAFIVWRLVQLREAPK